MNSHESEASINIWITLECTRRSVAPTKEGEYPDPGSGPEFEISEILVGEDRELKSWSDLIEFVEIDEANRLLEAAKKEAKETGGF